MYFPGTPSIAENVVKPGPMKVAQSMYFNAFRAARIRPDFGYNIAWDPSMLLLDALCKVGTGASAMQLRDYVLNLHGWTGINGTYDFSDGRQRVSARGRP